MKTIIIALLCLQVFSDRLNEFSGDVDIYDLGTMNRGKNAGLWQHSSENKYDVLYYLAMQPWRHIIWTSFENGVFVTRVINEDHNVKNFNTLNTDSNQDFCQKDYGYPVSKYEIDWNRVPTDSTRLKAVDINGKTCYQYPAKSPLVYVALSEKMTAETKTENYDICRFDFIGGKTITFRSFNGLNQDFIVEYNKTAIKCQKDFTKNNVGTELALIFGISDKAALKSVQSAFNDFKSLSTLSSVTVYYLKGESYQTLKITKEQLTYATLSSIEPSKGKVDTLIVAASRDLEAKVTKKTIKRGAILVLTDDGINREFNAETDFDRKNLTVHVVSLNRQGDAMTAKLQTLLSLGGHFHETSDTNKVAEQIKEAFNIIRANLTERCDRNKCNGFCDAKNRCTCPMCCENTCFYSFCNTTSGTCTPWPPVNPKQKVKCPSNCIGDYTCKDLEGCVVSRYNNSCEPKVACMKPTCPNGDKGTCSIQDNCPQDDVPATDGYCWTYKCDSNSGYCIKHTKGAEKCPTKTSLCQQYKCDANLKCRVENKVCVKTIPYVEMDCYVAKCNEKTGQCENKLSCDTFTSCGGQTSTTSICKCDASTNNKCQCDKVAGGNYCDSDKNEICDYTHEPPKCVASRCKEDLTSKNCLKATCNETDGTLLWNPITCDQKVIVDDVNKCNNTFGYVCKDNACVVEQIVTDEALQVDCGVCKYDTAQKKVVHISTCTTQKSTCGEFQGQCVDKKCIYPQTAGKDPNDFCQTCLSLECGADKTAYNYEYNNATGRCSYTTLKLPQCSVCVNGAYMQYCKDVVLHKTWTSDDGVELQYTLPKDCRSGDCIPRYPMSCMETEYFGEILKTFGECSDGDYLEASYHYSSKLDVYKLNYGFPQSPDFIEEADKEAYCVWKFKKTNCKKCISHQTNSSFEIVDECPRQSGGVDYICSDNECTIDPDFKCQPQNCVVKNMPEGKTECEDLYNLCDNSTAKLNSAREKEFAKYDTVGRTMSCGTTNCISNKCPTLSDDTKCQSTEEHPDYGCRKAAHICDTEKDVFWCSFTPLNGPEDDDEFFLTRDNVKLNNKCYNYICEETCTGGANTFEEYKTNTEAKKCTHKWVLDEKNSNVDPKPRNLCEDATCNKATGLTEYKDKSCFVAEEFPTLTANQARCFYCQCSYIDGSASLVMFAETETEFYQLDACGNCMVMNQTDRTQQLNEKAECILAGEINNTGAIAAATTVAAVVVALVVALVAVSIGVFKTYQLVSSAMKNVVNTANENAQFKAADNEAANTNFTT
ncbi:170 kDa surface lectin precursor, putative [Entamoeba invadens IP1]|uniref:170 kDa surface lectin, putative n=1 Tax=Entamoeba invadens IP1 TaxID=370355 RepID=A0A0A1TUL8_ENTIV|nr:170 kDa surface lectin precursor, putative [Entamoeba invadens IP1]ELP83772.1 170 kDa surface lectin precursor, putative [Entamoeba invadens IP1]|eukprot:XP_004183118.1 170 kDa surface lectin precursor, putative [Entamoeba invadens IP1]